MALISVILPCYNMAGYIDRSMKTIVNQTIGIENLEVILVNDASTDNTLDKLKEWEEKYPDNIMVITYEENMRQGGARNIGMQYSTSEYIGFVDPDDYIEYDMYESLYEKTKEKKYDVVYGKTMRQQYTKDGWIYEEVKKKRQDRVYKGEDKGGWYAIDMEVEKDMGGVFTGIYRRDLIINNNLWFPEKMAYEDNYWGAILKLYLKSVYVMDKIVYHYCINPQSTIQKKKSNHHLDRLDIEVWIIEKYKEIGAFEYYKEELEKNFIQRFYLNTMFLVFTKLDYIPDIFEYMRNKILEYFPNYKENPGVRNVSDIEKLLLKILDIPQELKPEDLEGIKKAYLEAFN